MKRQALACLEKLLPTIPDRDQRRELREATNHPARSLTPTWWVDDLHLVKLQATIQGIFAANRAPAAIAIAIAEADRPTCKTNSQPSHRKCAPNP